MVNGISIVVCNFVVLWIDVETLLRANWITYIYIDIIDMPWYYQLSIDVSNDTLLISSLYNKESVIEFLLEKKDLDKFSHLRGLKDVKELNLTDNPALSREDDKMDISDASKYVCPVTGLEMSGKHR